MTTATSSPSLPPAASSGAARPGDQADELGGALPRICCSWLVRAETIGRALGATEPGNVGNAESVSAGAGGGGGAAGGRPPCDEADVALPLLLLLFPPPPTLAADADHAVFRPDCLRKFGGAC